MLTGVMVFLLLLVALLAIPITLIFQISWKQDFHGTIDLLWLFGLVRIHVPLNQSRVISAQDDIAAPQHADNERSATNKRNIFSVIRQQSFRRRIFRFINDCWHALHKRDVYLRVRVGLGDPADTGQLWAVVGPLSGMLGCVNQATIVIEPEFVDTTFELDSSGSIRILPLQILYLSVALLLSPTVWRGIRQMRVAG